MKREFTIERHVARTVEVYAEALGRQAVAAEHP